MPKPICVKCKRFFKPKKNGVYVVEQMPVDRTAQAGADEGWTPYKVWMADKLSCGGCGTEIIVGFGHRPLSEHYQPNFENALARATVTVNDC